MILLGVNSSGIIHYGNYKTIIQPVLNIKKKIFFIADLHSISKCKNIFFLLKNKIIITLILYIYFKKIIFYQSNNKNIIFYFWIISCFFNINKIKFFHLLKKKIFFTLGNLSYPLLMFCDINLSNNNFILLGKDQIQHIELIKKINKTFFSFLKLNKKINFIINNNTIYSFNKKKMSKTNKNSLFIFSNYNKIYFFFKKFLFTLKKKKSLLNFSYLILKYNFIKNVFFNYNYNYFLFFITELFYIFFLKKKNIFYNKIKINYLIDFLNKNNKYFIKYTFNNIKNIKKIFNL